MSSVTGWLVSDVTDSDHRLLSYTVDLPSHAKKINDITLKEQTWTSSPTNLPGLHYR